MEGRCCGGFVRNSLGRLGREVVVGGVFIVVCLKCSREFFGVGGWLGEWICVILMIASVILI